MPPSTDQLFFLFTSETLKSGACGWVLVVPAKLLHQFVVDINRKKCLCSPFFFSHFTSIIIHVSKSAIDSNKYLGCPQQYLNEILNFGPLCRGYEEQQPIQQQQPSRPRPVYPNPSPKRTIDTKRKAVSTRYLLVDTI